jgi:hypothetical protein
MFSTVTNVLRENKTSLNQADDYNHNHGDNMVDIFKTITQAVQEKQNASPAEQFENASKLVQKENSGSAKIYSQGLANAAAQFRGKQLTPENGLELITSLLGGAQQSQTQAPGGDAFGGLAESLMAGFMGDGQPQQTNQQAGGLDTGDLLSSLMGNAQPQQASQDAGGFDAGDLLSSLMGSAQPQQSSQEADGFDAGDLLQVGMAFLQAKQTGQSTIQAAINAAMSSGPLAGSTHREQSGSLVANTLLQAMGALSKK